MKIGLIDVDGHNFLNFALVKLSEYRKACGDAVEWCNRMETYGRNARILRIVRKRSRMKDR